MMPDFPFVLQQLGERLHQVWLTQAADQHLIVPETLMAHPDCIRVMALSDYVVRIVQKSPTLLISLWSSGELSRLKTEAEYHHEVEKITQAIAPNALQNEKTLAQQLRFYRQREMVRLIWRHLLGTASFKETTQELSFLANAVILKIVEWLHRLWVHHYQLKILPPLLSVIALGKLGACELNLSSDIDLMYVAPLDTLENIPGSEIAYHTFYETLAKKLTALIQETTQEGFLFRVDLRLRPYGNSGPLVMNSEALENYYSEQGRDWERYALVKARVVTSLEEEKKIDALIRPFVYRRYIDFGAIKALREMHQLLLQSVRVKGLQEDIKKGPGGIREIEFLMQAFQLIHGGRDASLRERNLLKVIDILTQRHLLGAEEAQKFKEAYLFFRQTEHTVQAFRDQQTHQLPQEETDQLRLAWVMGFADWDAFYTVLKAHRQWIEQEFKAFSAVPPMPAESVDTAYHTFQALWRDLLEEGEACAHLQSLGVAQPQTFIQLIQGFSQQTQMTSVTAIARQRLDALMPLLLEKLMQQPEPQEVFTRISEVLSAILKRSAYLVLLLENPQALEWLVKLCAKSRLISEELSQNPVLLDELLDLRVLHHAPRKLPLQAELRELLARENTDDLEAQMEVLRYFKKVNVLRVAAANVMGWLPLMRVSDSLTDIAQVILEKVFQLAYMQIVSEYKTVTLPPLDELPLGVLAYGKFAGFELGYGSDLDLVFIYDDHFEPAIPMDFYLRLVRRILHLLSTRTHLGVLYEVDTQLRPLGHAGLLVSSLSFFKEYQETQAWTWEHQALIRTRIVLGSPALQTQFKKIRRQLLLQPRDPVILAKEVAEMREKMRKQKTTAATEWDVKNGEGGIIDIEFLVQYWVLQFAAKRAVLLRYPDNMRILDLLEATQLIPSSSAELLREAYCTFRDRVHALHLVKKTGMVAALEYQTLRQRVIQIWRETLLKEENTDVYGK